MDQGALRWKELGDHADLPHGNYVEGQTAGIIPLYPFAHAEGVQQLFLICHPEVANVVGVIMPVLMTLLAE